MAQTTEERIAQIANNFGQGFQNYQQQRQMQENRSLQEEARRRQQAIQEMEVEAKLSESTGKNFMGSGAGKAFLSGSYNAANYGDLGLTRKAELEKGRLERESEDRVLKHKVMESQIIKNNRGPADKWTQNEQDRNFKATDSLRKEITSHPATKDMIDIDSALGKISTAPESAYGDMGMIFSYNKILDPGSTVREGEFANAENAKGWDQKMIGLYNKAVSGQRLTLAQRKEIVDSVVNLAKSQYGNWKATLSPQRKRLEDLKLDPTQIMPQFSMQSIYDTPMVQGASTTNATPQRITDRAPTQASSQLVQKVRSYTPEQIEARKAELRRKAGIQ